MSCIKLSGIQSIVNYSGYLNFLTMLSYLLAQKRWGLLLNCDCLVLSTSATKNYDLQME